MDQLQINFDRYSKWTRLCKQLRAQHIPCHKSVVIKTEEAKMKNGARYMDRKQSRIKMNMDEAALADSVNGILVTNRRQHIPSHNNEETVVPIDTKIHNIWLFQLIKGRRVL